MMAPKSEPARHIFLSIAFGACVALINSVLDLFFAHAGIAPATTFLNDLLIGAATASLAYIWVARQIQSQERAVSAERIRHEGVLQERSRIAQEFHDSLAQNLTGLILQMEAAQESFDEHTAAGKCERRALELARKALRETRRSLRDLRPEALEEEELASAIARASKELIDGTPLKVEFCFSGSIRRLPTATETALLRISQEALTNVVRHADARRAHIELCFGAEEAHLRVADDGQGFPPKRRAGGFGLTSMEERAKALGGTWLIQSEPGQGTEIRASIPICPPGQQ